ncbi:Helicase SEN1 [Pseudocercospora fuligena]|uniref:Helicase SEN1 n=1 Tax=Pseudocercospora fuligena TaxID=685502 RepID=A0A8H6VN90_9PEZI|nr:Helicase SEN1 [Pseudocercospora fuligena]
MAQPLSDVLAYRDKLTDALTGGEVTARTQLAPLYRPHPTSLVAHLTGIAYPAKPCTLIARGACFPPRDFNGSPQYELYLTVNRLLTAPTLRLECIWREQKLRIALEFPFFDCATSLGGLTFHRDVERYGTLSDEARFEAHGASSQGLNRARSLGPEVLGPAGQQIITELRTYLANTPKVMRLRFDTPLEDDRYPFSAILPYITEMPLPSLSAPEWATLRPLRPERDLTGMMSNPAAPFPMVPLAGLDTFLSAMHASVEYYESTRVAWLEQEVSLKEWASVAHRGVLYRVGGAVALAIRFSPFRLLGGPEGVVKFDLPDRFLADVTFELSPEHGEQRMLCERSPVPISIDWAHDALFVLRKPNAAVRDAAARPSHSNVDKRIIRAKFDPRMPVHQLGNKLTTAINVQHADRWQKVLLNQDHESLPTINLATGQVVRADQNAPWTPTEVDKVVEEAFTWMLSWRKWNAEQLEALVSVREAVGGIVLISGPAGTGKTLLIQAICVFLYKIGLHVLVLAPANSNLSDFIGKLKELFGNHSNSPVKATRVYPISADFSPKKIASGQTCIHTPESTQEDDTGDILDFEMVRSDLQYSDDKYTSHRDYGLPAQVFRAARDETYELWERLPGSEADEQVDIWSVLRQSMKEAAEGSFRWGDQIQVKRYQMAYDRCKAHYLAHVRMICTTTGNVRCTDIVENWAANKYGTETKGIVVVLDEACKDNEIDSVSALLHPEWRDKIHGMVMLGDERQLEPCNTGASGRMVFNYFNDRISIPLMSRLTREGFPCVQLLEQHRMSHHIAEWPFKEFYPTGMRNGPSTYLTLRQKLPGLFDCLTGILKDLGTVFTNPLQTEAELDRSVRTHYLEIDGNRDNSKRSAFVLEHVRFFCDKIYWNLRAYFVEKTNEKVLVICAYKEAKLCYEDAMRYIQRKYHIPDSQLPRIATIDSSQGAEAPVTIIDCSVQKYDPRRRRADIGFVDDDKRMNVAMTRAQEVRWILGGNCEYISPPLPFLPTNVLLSGNTGNAMKRLLRESNTPAYVRYKMSVSKYSGDMTDVDQSGEERLQREGNRWLRGLRAHAANVTSNYKDDVQRQLARL